MNKDYVYCGFPKEPPSYEEFYKMFRRFVSDVRIQGDQLFEGFDALTMSVDRLYGFDRNEEDTE